VYENKGVYPMRRRAPGGGRKPLKPADRNSEIVSVRIRPDERRALERLAGKHNRKLSREMQRALADWIERHHNRPPHIEALGWIAVQLGQYAEFFTRKKWTDDPHTAQTIVTALNQLMTFLDLDRVAKKRSGPEFDSTKLGRVAAREVVMGLHVAGIRPEEYHAGLKSPAADDDVVNALKRTFKNLGSRKQLLERLTEETFK
jgi:predicted transcriptional regulator